VAAGLWERVQVQQRGVEGEQVGGFLGGGVAGLGGREEGVCASFMQYGLVV